MAKISLKKPPTVLLLVSTYYLGYKQHLSYSKHNFLAIGSITSRHCGPGSLTPDSSLGPRFTKLLGFNANKSGGEEHGQNKQEKTLPFGC